MPLTDEERAAEEAEFCLRLEGSEEEKEKMVLLKTQALAAFNECRTHRYMQEHAGCHTIAIDVSNHTKVNVEFRHAEFGLTHIKIRHGYGEMEDR